MIEDKLWNILDCLRKSETVLPLCEEWWQLNNHEGVASLEVGRMVISRDYFEMTKPDED